MAARKTRKIVSKCEFRTKADNANIHSVTFNDLTDGEILALIHALMLARIASPVAQDLSDYLLFSLLQAVATLDKENADKAQRFVQELNGDMGLALINRDALEQMRSELMKLRKD